MTTWTNRDEAFLSVAQGIRRAASELTRAKSGSTVEKSIQQGRDSFAYRIANEVAPRTLPTTPIKPLTPKETDPQVIVEYEWSEGRELGARFGTVKNRPFILLNRGKSDAYNIQIQDIKLPNGVARFAPISKILAGGQASIHSEIEKYGGGSILFRKDFELFIRDWWDKQPNEGLQDDKYFVVSIPVAVAFEDVHGSKFQTKAEIEYHCLHATAKTIHTGYKRLS